MSGGAWKVAYADFVTAMMALFMVLWISAQDQKILIATSQYFQSPFRSPVEDHSGIMPFNKQERNSSSSDGKKNDESATGREKPTDSTKQIELKFLNSVAADFYRLLHLDETLEDRPIEVQVTSDGLRVTLYDRAKRPLFDDNDAQFTDWGRFVMQSLAWIIDRHKFHVTIDGHTRTGLAFQNPDYGAWELSSDRANAARRALVHYAVEDTLIDRVTGFADTQCLPGIPTDSEANQRVTLSLRLTPRIRTERDTEGQVPPGSGMGDGPATPAAAQSTPPSATGAGQHVAALH